MQTQPSPIRQSLHCMSFGAEVQPSGGVRFRLWAPSCAQVSLALQDGARETVLAMSAQADGWHESTIAAAHPGQSYQFILADGLRVPDPASRYQPQDVHGPSEVMDPTAYRWRDQDWRGRPWHETILYELHVGTFTTAGTFSGVRERLDHLAALGVTAIELMPVSDFPGRRNWGYDGVLPYAPDASYGRPDDFKALVDAAHARGMMVFLDVVYNHFGPDGNYLSVHSKDFFTRRHATPWGDAINLDGANSRPVREFIIHNALYWIEEFHLDGLRLDAVHAIVDESSVHLLDELAERVRALHPAVHLVLENEENDTARLARSAKGAPLRYTAQWNDDLHHVLHVAATGEKEGYYQDYHGPADLLARVLAEGFAFQGQVMPYRGASRGTPSAHLPPLAFVAFLQNHDQIGNRAYGERIAALASADAVRACAALYLLLPQIPMLFMGEEWQTSTPFPYFCDFAGDLGAAVTRGRLAEFARFRAFQDPAAAARIPDPQDEATFQAAKLRWSDLEDAGHAEWLTFYRRLLAVRHSTIVPLLPALHGSATTHRARGPGTAFVEWRMEGGSYSRLSVAANLSPRPIDFPALRGCLLLQQGVDGGAPWSVRWSID